MNFYIPNIIQLDYMWKNFNIIKKSLESISDENKIINFLTRIKEHGLIATYKNKYYQWLPTDNKRIINNLTICQPYEILPMFTVFI